MAAPTHRVAGIQETSACHNDNEHDMLRSQILYENFQCCRGGSTVVLLQLWPQAAPSSRPMAHIAALCTIYRLLPMGANGFNFAASQFCLAFDPPPLPTVARPPPPPPPSPPVLGPPPPPNNCDNSGGVQQDCFNCNLNCFDRTCPGTTAPNCQYNGPCCAMITSPGSCQGAVRPPFSASPPLGASLTVPLVHLLLLPD